MTYTTKDQLHHLVDQLPASTSGPAVQVLTFLLEEPAAALKFLEGITDPVLRALRAAPIDDEPETEDERAAVGEGREAWQRGEVVTDAELRRGLKL